MARSPSSTRFICMSASFLATIAASSAASAGGRPDDESQNWFPDLSAGWAFPEGDSNDVLDDDWTLSGGATYWPSDWPVGLKFGLTWAEFDISDEAISRINTAVLGDPNNSGRIDGGDLETWQLTVNVLWGPGTESNGFYLSGGIGAYDLKGTLTQDGLVYYPPFCDPWYWWWCYPGGFGVDAIPVQSDSTTEIGYNLGLGYAIEAGDGQFFIEAKYHYIDTDTAEVTYTPLIFGYRW